MLTTSQIKKEARERFAVNRYQAMLAYSVVYMLFVGLAMMTTLLALVTRSIHALSIVLWWYGLTVILVYFVMLAPFRYSMAGFYLKSYRAQKADVSTMFDGFSRYNLERGVILHVLRTLLTLAFTILLIVPGIIFAVRTSMAVYLLRANPNMKPTDALKASNKVMKGHSWAYFVLNLSFIGWFFFGIVTLFAGFVWVSPYINTSQVVFYKRVLQGDATVYGPVNAPQAQQQPPQQPLQGYQAAPQQMQQPQPAQMQPPQQSFVEPQPIAVEDEPAYIEPQPIVPEPEVTDFDITTVNATMNATPSTVSEMPEIPEMPEEVAPELEFVTPPTDAAQASDGIPTLEELFGEPIDSATLTTMETQSALTDGDFEPFDHAASYTESTPDPSTKSFGEFHSEMFIPTETASSADGEQPRKPSFEPQTTTIRPTRIPSQREQTPPRVKVERKRAVDSVRRHETEKSEEKEKTPTRAEILAARREEERKAKLEKLKNRQEQFTAPSRPVPTHTERKVVPHDVEPFVAPPRPVPPTKTTVRAEKNDPHTVKPTQPVPPKPVTSKSAEPKDEPQIIAPLPPEKKPDPITVKPAPAVEPEIVVEPAPAVEPEIVVEPAPAVEPEIVVEPAPAVEPEIVVEPAPAVEPEIVVEPAPAVEPEIVVEPAPAVEPEPAPIPVPNGTAFSEPMVLEGIEFETEEEAPAPPPPVVRQFSPKRDESLDDLFKPEKLDIEIEE